MKKILGFIFDALILLVAFIGSDIIVQKMQITSLVGEIVIFVAIALFLELIKFLIFRPFKK